MTEFAKPYYMVDRHLWLYDKCQTNSSGTSRGVEKVSLNLPNNNLDYGDRYGQKKMTTLSDSHSFSGGTKLNQ